MCLIFEAGKKRLRSIKMLMSFDKTVDSTEEKSEIIFNVSLITRVPGLLEMIAGRCVLN